MKQFPIRISETIQYHFRLASLFKMTGLLETSCQPLNQSDPKLKSHVTWSLAFWRQFEANNMNHRWHPSISLVCYLFSLRPLWLHFFSVTKLKWRPLYTTLQSRSIWDYIQIRTWFHFVVNQFFQLRCKTKLKTTGVGFILPPCACSSLISSDKRKELNDNVKFNRLYSLH